jgi:RimJ/RimL family protein N-acetyltransferase
LFKSDKALATYLDIKVESQWSEFGEPVFRWTYEKLSLPNVRKGWWSYLPVFKEENRLVGSCGFKGEPRNGMVEIGYEVRVSHRGKGLASEMASALVQHAFTHEEVTKVQAHTLAQENASCSILRKLGMKKMEELEDIDDGLVWRWEVCKG